MDGDVVCPSVYPMAAPFHVHALLFVYSMIREPYLCLLVLSWQLSLSSAYLFLSGFCLSTVDLRESQIQSEFLVENIPPMRLVAGYCLDCFCCPSK